MFPSHLKQSLFTNGGGEYDYEDLALKGDDYNADRALDKQGYFAQLFRAPEEPLAKMRRLMAAGNVPDDLRELAEGVRGAPEARARSPVRASLPPVHSHRKE